MDPEASLKQTATHLFDAVRYSNHARELEEAARSAEATRDAELSKLEGKLEELSKILASMKSGSAEALGQLSDQVREFLGTAKEQAEEKLRNKAKEQLEEHRARAYSERDKALKSLEAYLVSDPLPIIENVVQVRLVEGLYEAHSRYECEGGIKYDFGLSAQNSRLFHQELSLSQFGYELKIPVRFSRALLKKGRVPGFERLDQYFLVNAETSDGRIHASFHKPGNGTSLKVVTSGSKQDDFVGIEYHDQSETVNVMNDHALAAYVDLASIRKAMGELVAGLGDVAEKKVALLRFSLDGEESLDNLDYQKILQSVLSVLGPSYRGVLKKVSGKTGPVGKEGLSMSFVQERLKVLGGLSGPVSETLGLPNPQLGET